MARIVIETADPVAQQAVAALCHCAGFEVPPEVTDVAEIAALKEEAAKTKLLDIIGEAVQSYQEVLAKAAIAAARSNMKQVTTVTVE